MSCADDKDCINGVVYMSKIGIMTWFQYHNYGTALQVTALSETIKKLNHSSTVVKYYTQSGSIDDWKKPFIKYAADKVFCKIKTVIHSSYTSEAMEKRFINFLLNKVKFTTECDTLSKLESLNEKFDYFICGSDQIWAPSCFDSRYFLDFVSDNSKKIAYAPSIGLPEIENEDVKKEMARLASSFAYLSTREESGSRMIHDITGRDVKTVLDPTLLLNKDEWNKFASESVCFPSSPYLLGYMLGTNEAHWRKIYQIAKKLNLKVKIIPVYKKDLKRAGCVEEPIGPAEFLSLIRSASYICTDSFHGMAFSVNYNKPFTVFQRFKENDKLNQNSRIYNLANKLNLNDRVFRKSPDIKMIFSHIDYNSINEKREFLVKESIDYLRRALTNRDVPSTSERKNNLRKNFSICCGCSSCKLVCPVNAIDIRLSGNGFYEAVFDNNKCISCGRCFEVCPYVNNRFNKHITEGKIYSFKSRNPDVLQKSSSGGAAYHISQLMLNKAYSVAGCTFDVQAQQAMHIIVNPAQKELLFKLQGSKYMQSSFSSAAEIMYHSKNDKYLIIGTPCQIAGIKNLLKERKDIVYVDLICHGVPSYHLYEKYKDYLARKEHIGPDNLEVIFRDKRLGWRERYIYTRDLNRGKSTHQNKDPYFLSFEHGFCYSHGCYECPWRDSSAADLRLGDYWGDRFIKDKTGVSEVIALTEVGEKTISDLLSAGCAEIKNQQITDYTLFQQTRNNRKPVFWQRYIDALSSADRNLEDIVKEYVMPSERQQRLCKKVYATINLIRRKKIG